MLEKIALQKGLISKENFQKAIDACKNIPNYENALKDYFISNNLISAKKLELLVDTLSAIKIIKKNMKFGEVALKLGFVDNQVLQEALLKQKKNAAKQKQPKLIGQILFETGKLNKEQITSIVNEQKRSNLKLKTIKNEIGPESTPEKSTPKQPGMKEEKKFQSSEIIQGGMVLEIDENAFAAYLRKTEKFNDTVTVEDIFAILTGRMIQYGIVVDQMIEGFINSSGFRTNRFKVASGDKKVQGRDARIEYLFDTDYLKAGGMDEKGNIDFKDRGEIPKIDEGTLLAEKIPIKKSINGRNIFGQEIEAVPVNDIQLKTQTGAYLSEDGTRIYAEISGFPKLAWSGNINVLDLFIVNGDVSYETGHVSYEGNIDVKGCLKSGFQIKGNTITILEIDGGKITADGDVTIINGVNDATIYSRGHVSAKFIHNSTISCLGNLIVEKEIVDSKIDASGACKIDKGEVINSQISANKGVMVKNIGTERTHPNTITVGQNIYLENELLRIDEKIIDIQSSTKKEENKKARLELEDIRYHKTASKTANELDKARDEGHLLKQQIKALTEQPDELRSFKRQLQQNTALFNRLDKELNDCFDIIESNGTAIQDIKDQLLEFGELLDDLDYEKNNFTEWGKANDGNPLVVVDGKACSETIVKGIHSQKELKETISRAKIKEVSLKNNDTEYGIYEIQIHDNFK
ncbi:MAG: FapA family protein [Desulfobacula sp.]|nr:FapA family protein [Desulfobacula sp.]